ncbi:ricin-type beta-trefoil lectin domain protein [Streptomyces sp. NPDC021608]|uniref:ricin-type beta-trefoil lectin domain protein n=1 Tax=Streptomyces sp. NPDC021608 TaxID=3154903 RepID=UPI0033E0BC09
MSRKVTTTGPLSTAFTISGGGKRCVDDAGGSTTAGTKVQINTCNGATSEKWTVGTDGTVKVLGMCLDTSGNATASGTLVVIDTCKTDATQKWKVTTTGTLVNNANSAMCLTDPGASATNSTQLTIATCGASGQTWTSAATGAIPAGQTQTFTYDAEGHTATVATTSGTHTNTSKYLYDAKGGLLEQTAAVDGVDKTRVLYLFGGTEQITLNVAAKTWTGLRNITGPDGTTVTRSSTGTVTYQVANGQGTALTAVNAATLAVTRRSFDPWGNPRGAKPGSWVAPDENHGFLGQPADPVTGLNLLGARNYDPVIGRFLTPDPLFQAGDPNQMGGYTYAADNPASSSDPTGFDDWYNDPSMNKCVIDCNPTPSPSPAPAPTSTSSGGGGGSSTPQPSPGLTPPATPPDPKAAPDLLYSSIVDIGLAIRSLSVCEFWLTGSGADHDQACQIAGGVVSGGGMEGSGIGALERGAAGEGESALVNTARGGADADAAAAAGAGAKAVDEAASDVADLAALKRANAQEHAAETNAKAARPSKPEEGNAGTKPAESAARCSFSPDTPVLMAGGKTKEIGKIKVGDKVEAADQKTAKHTGTREVVATLVNHDTDLIDVKVRTSGHHTATLHTTSKHPFWDATTHAWVAAGKLKARHTLATDSGHRIDVVEVRVTQGAADRYNLTVRELHTYYVVAGGLPILVHNACPKHTAEVTVMDGGGNIRGAGASEEGPANYWAGRQSGAEKAQGKYKGGLISHTESRATRVAGVPHVYWKGGDDPLLGRSPAIAGDTYLIEGRLPPCDWCQAQMEEAALSTKTNWVYTWLDDGGIRQYWWRGPAG